ncbi:MAG: hypothetical protein ACM30G_07260 [Micromonosporaceae bacterium]
MRQPFDLCELDPGAVRPQPLGVGASIGQERLRESFRPPPPSTDEPPWRGRAYLVGFLSTATNSKVGLFLLAFLPQFVPTGYPVASTMATLAAVYLSIATGWMCILVELIYRLRQRVLTPAVVVTLRRITAWSSSPWPPGFWSRPNYQREGLPRDGRLLKTLWQANNMRLGVYAKVIVEGSIGVGDRVDHQMTQGMIEFERLPRRTDPDARRRRRAARRAAGHPDTDGDLLLFRSG